MPENLPPGSDPAYEGKNKYGEGEGVKDKLDDSDHVATDPLINVQGDDHPENHPGAYHPGDHDDKPLSSETPEETEQKAERPLQRHVTTSEHDAPPTLITPGRIA